MKALLHITIFLLFSCYNSSVRKKPQYSIDEITQLEVKCGDYWKKVNLYVKNSILDNLDSSDEVSLIKGIPLFDMRMVTKTKDTLRFQVLKDYVTWESGWSSKSTIDSNLFNYICSYSTFTENIPIASLWDALVNEYGGCLTGGQRIHRGNIGNEGCVLTKNKNWNTFFNKPKSEKIAFLTRLFADTAITNIHTCPFSLATTGEIAIYVAQEAAVMNWYELPSFTSYGEMIKSGTGEGNSQIWLQKLLSDEKSRKKLIKEFYESTN